MFAVRRSLRNTVVKRTSPLKIITPPVLKQKRPSKFEEVPYHEQYETRDFVFTEKDIKRYELNCLR